MPSFRSRTQPGSLRSKTGRLVWYGNREKRRPARRGENTQAVAKRMTYGGRYLRNENVLLIGLYGVA
jgi:hypothetical protein